MHSRVVVEVSQLETEEAVERLRSGGADLAVVHYMPGIAVPETGDLQRRRLLVDHLYVVSPEPRSPAVKRWGSPISPT